MVEMPIGESPEVMSQTRGALCVGNCAFDEGAVAAPVLMSLLELSEAMTRA